MAIDGFDDSARERLSALADGELGPADLAASCTAWSQDPRLRVDWHAWHLIGDVLRSDDLAVEPGRDQRFCAALRTRLQGEPVVLAPAPAAATAARLERLRRPARWTAAGAVAAGVVLVVGTFVVLRPGEAPAPAQVARADGPAPTNAATAATAPVEVTAQPVAIIADSKIIRDAQLERYLEAHKQFAGSSALGVPSAFLRSATVDSAAR